MDRIGNIEIERPTAPDLVLDLLIAHGGALAAETLCRAGALFGIGASATRVALTRLAASGKIVRQERGLYRICPAGQPLSRAVDDWRQRHHHTTAWNADWIAVHDSTVRRSDKTAWRRHSLALALRGFAALQPMLYIRPNNLAGGLGAEQARLSEIGLAPSALVFRLADLRSLEQAQAKALWDVARLAAEHRALRAALRESERLLRRSSLEAALCESLAVGRTVIGHLLRDPVLPVEMMSPTSRLKLVDAMTAYQGTALALWRRWFGRT